MTGNRHRNPMSSGAQPDPRSGSIIRVDHQVGRWEAIPRALIEDKDLSFLARWLAIWLASRPPGWEIRSGTLPRLLKDRSRLSGYLGRDSTRRLLKELEATGYLRRRRYQDSAGKWIWQSCFDATKNVASAMPWKSVDGEPVDGTSGDITNTDLDSRLIESTPTTTTTCGPTAPNGTEAVVVVPLGELEFPDVLKGHLAPSALTLIERCPAPLRQLVLDEIRMLASKGKVRSPVGLLHRLVERAGVGTFVASHRLPARNRAQRVDRTASPAAAINGVSQVSPIATPEFAKQRLAELRGKLGGSQLHREPREN